MILPIAGVIFTLTMVEKLKSLQANFANLPTTYQAGYGKAFSDTKLDNAWISCLVGVVLSCCIGSCVVGIAQYMLKTRNLKCCCILEGCCSAVYCCYGSLVTLMVLGCFAMMGALSDPVTLCTTGPTVAPGLTTTTVAVPQVGDLGANPTAFPGGPQACTATVEILKEISVCYGIFLGIAALVYCCAACTCGAGAKYANETQEIFDMEGGGGYQKPGGYY
jgi:hypothetical protein